MNRSNTKWMLPVVLALFPILGIGIYGLFFSSSASIDLDRMDVLERWREGTPKSVGREWKDGDDDFLEFCSLTPAGEKKSCGVQKNSRPWNGTFVNWYWYDPKTPNNKEAYGIVRNLSSYKDGKPHGPWRGYYESGVLSSEIIYENGRRVSWSIYGPAGQLVNQGKEGATGDPKKETEEEEDEK